MLRDAYDKVSIKYAASTPTPVRSNPNSDVALHNVDMANTEADIEFFEEVLAAPYTSARHTARLVRHWGIIEFGGPGSGPRNREGGVGRLERERVGRKSKGIAGIAAEAARVNELLSVPRMGDYGTSEQQVGANSSLFIQRSGSQISTADAKLSPRLVEAEIAVRGIGSSIMTEVEGRLAAKGLESPLTTTKAVEIADAKDRFEKSYMSVRDAKTDTVTKVIIDRFGSKEAALQAIGDAVEEHTGSRNESQIYNQFSALEFAIGKAIPVLDLAEMSQNPPTATEPLVFDSNFMRSTDLQYGIADLMTANGPLTYDGTKRYDALVEMDTASKEVTRAGKGLNELTLEWDASLREVLGEVRTLGGVATEAEVKGLGPSSNADWFGGVDELVGNSEATFDKALSKLPADWVELSNREGARAGEPLTINLLASGGRAFYQRTDSAREEAGNDVASINVGAKDNEAVYAHEFVHHLQTLDPGWEALDRAFLERRVGNAQPVWLGDPYPPTEMATPDDFTRGYIGKTYPEQSYWRQNVGGTPDLLPAQSIGLTTNGSMAEMSGGGRKYVASEVSTVGTQAYVLGGSAGLSSFTRASDNMADDDYISYIIGVLATMGAT